MIFVLLFELSGNWLSNELDIVSELNSVELSPESNIDEEILSNLWSFMFVIYSDDITGLSFVKEVDSRL